MEVIGVSENDLLIISSDHGMTIDSATYRPNQSSKETEWSLELKEVHIRNLFMIQHRSITPVLYKNVFSDKYISKVLEVAMEGKGLPTSRVDIICDKEYAISSGGGNYTLINNKCYRDDYGEQIFSLRTDREKWICQPNIGSKFCEYYDLEQDVTELYPKLISFFELPIALREYIINVQSSRAFYKRLILYMTASNRKSRIKNGIINIWKRIKFLIKRKTSK